MLRKSLLIGAALFLALVAFAGTASAAIPIKLNLGPIPVPSVPLQVCVGSTCTTVENPKTVSLSIAAEVAKPGLAVVPPTVLPALCPAGKLGLAATVTPGSLGVTVTGSVKVGVNGSGPVTVPVNLNLTPGSPPATISACVG
jgi:hypothetical protein